MPRLVVSLGLLLVVWGLVGASAVAAAAPAAELTVVVPRAAEPAYAIAGDEFVKLWEQITGRRPKLVPAEPQQRTPPAGDVILLGSDAVNPIVHGLIRSAALESLGIAYGTDDYCLRSVPRDGGRCLIVAGGCGRSTLYAVYDFFRRQAGAEYFWDGDILPHRDRLELAGLDVRQSPHYQYRGLRYFAHRGLHRFQAEHWDLDDWKREIDWLVKKRFNLFMLRIGIDDLFQRAFPGEVSYPPIDGPDPDAVPRSYNDRTSFWPLRYRGQLRKAVLQYARDRGLIHPEDVGTITHWYSHTPSSFYASHPGFPVIQDQTRGYSLATHAIWDIEDQRTWDAYWRLSATHLREFGSPRMFHTIGMAERVFGSDDRDNFQRKLYVYRKTQERLRQHYPDAPLLIASWDFIGWKWTNEGVRRLTEEFDPQRTIIHDYTADLVNKVTYRDWGLLGRFPWTFGIFHSFARNSDIHEDYAVLTPRVKEAAADPQCRGMFLWSEISHSDTFLLEYLADNSWQPERAELRPAVERYCRTRYPAALQEAMRAVWRDFLVTSQSVHWSLGGTWSASWSEPQFRPLSGGLSTITPQRLEAMTTELQRIAPALEPAPAVLKRLADLAPQYYDDPLWRRDTLDMARTIASRALFVTLARGMARMEAWREQKCDPQQLRNTARLSQDLLAALAAVLGNSADFSMDASLRRLTRARDLDGVQPQVNPHSEMTLKGNAENDYCRSHHYELVEHVYRAELAAYWRWVLDRVERGDRSPWRTPPALKDEGRTIVDAFHARRLAEMAPPPAATGVKPLVAALDRLRQLVAEVVATP